MPPVSVLLPDPDTRLLRCHRSHSGYVNVYLHSKSRDGHPVYVAKVKRDGSLRSLPGSRSPHPHVCARFVVEWYRSQYGPGWRDVFASRMSRTRPAELPWRAWRSERWGGWLLEVWLDGRPEVVPLMVRRGRRRGRERRWVPHPERPKVFASEAEAVAFAHRAPLYRYGVLGAAMRVARRTVWGGLYAPPQAAPRRPGPQKPPKGRGPDRPDPPPFAPALARAA